MQWLYNSTACDSTSLESEKGEKGSGRAHGGGRKRDGDGAEGGKEVERSMLGQEGIHERLKCGSLQLSRSVPGRLKTPAAAVGRQLQLGGQSAEMTRLRLAVGEPERLPHWWVA